MQSGEKERAVMILAEVMRMEVAGPQIMLPDHDYERLVVRPAVEKFAAQHGVPLSWHDCST